MFSVSSTAPDDGNRHQRDDQKILMYLTEKNYSHMVINF